MILLWATSAWASLAEIVVPPGALASVRCPHGAPVMLVKQGLIGGGRLWATPLQPGRLCEVELDGEAVGWVPLWGRSLCDGEGCRSMDYDDRGVIEVSGRLSAPELHCSEGRIQGEPTQGNWVFLDAPLQPCWLWDGDRPQGDHPLTWGKWMLKRRSWLPDDKR